MRVVILARVSTDKQFYERQVVEIEQYCKSVGSYVHQGMDGVIQVKAFGCTPEIDAMPILQNISNDYRIPILNFSFDSQTSETGIKTRLEAFYDLMGADCNLGIVTPHQRPTMGIIKP